MPVDGDALDARALRDCTDRRPRRPDGVMEVDRRLDDPLPRGRLAFRSLVEGVFPGHGFGAGSGGLTPVGPIDSLSLSVNSIVYPKEEL